MDELLGYPTEFRPGRIRIALDDRQVAINERALANARHQGFQGERIDAAQLRELVPIAPPEVAGAFLWHFGGHANPQRTAQAYAWAIEDLGGRIRQHAAVHGIATEGDRAVSVLTDRGPVACGMVIVAAGPQTAALVEPLGVRLPLAPARAEILVTEPLPLMPVGGTDGNGLYGRQTLRGNLVYGGGPHEWLDEADAGSARRWGRAPTSTLTRDIAGRLAELFPRASHARVIRSWAGYVENTPDGRPVIERLEDPSNVIVATMSSVGFGLSPASGHAIRDLALDGRCSFADLSGFRLSRFSNLPADWRERYGWVPPESAGGTSYQGVF
jgi:sarcosine oxidase subunit beta